MPTRRQFIQLMGAAGAATLIPVALGARKFYHLVGKNHELVEDREYIVYQSLDDMWAWWGNLGELSIPRDRYQDRCRIDTLELTGPVVRESRITRIAPGKYESTYIEAGNTTTASWANDAFQFPSHTLMVVQGRHLRRVV